MRASEHPSIQRPTFVAYLSQRYIELMHKTGEDDGQTNVRTDERPPSQRTRAFVITHTRIARRRPGPFVHGVCRAGDGQSATVTMRTSRHSAHVPWTDVPVPVPVRAAAVPLSAPGLEQAGAAAGTDTSMMDLFRPKRKKF